jgi:hypothetical protein
MTVATPATAPRAGGPAVVLVRPASICDTNDYSVVVDEQGHFVANVPPGTRVVVGVSAGTHVFYAWDDVDLLVDREPNFNPVAAVRVTAGEAKTEYVALIVPMNGSDCVSSSGRTWVEMTVVRPGDDLARELPVWLGATKEIVADGRMGQAELISHPAHLETYLELGARKLRQIEEGAAHRESVKARDAEKY